MSIKYLQRAIEILGGQAALARAIGVSQPCIHYWIHRNRKVPSEQVLVIEKAVKGLVTRHQLRPDIYPSDELNQK